jgi:uncharacterized iron-regulated membrane protein
MAIVGAPTSRVSSAQVMLLTTGLPMFAFGMLAEVGVLAIGGMLMTLVGLLIWARRRGAEPEPPDERARRWWRYPVHIPLELAAGLGLNIAIAALWWLGSQ